MPAYAIFIREKTVDTNELKTYGEMARSTTAPYDAKPIVAYGAIDVLEGPEAEGVVIVQFPSMKEARSWYDSPGYQAAVQHRFKGAVYRGMLVEGL